MTSLPAQEVAREVIRQVERGGKPHITTIAPKKGYSPKTAHSGKIQKTQAYRSVIEPYAQRLQRHQEKILKAMEEKDLTQEGYKVLADALAKVTHDVQLLTGGSTANIQVKPIYGNRSNTTISGHNSDTESISTEKEDTSS